MKRWRERGMMRRLFALLILTLGMLPAANAQSPWGRDYFPNATLTTQDGTMVKFYDDLIQGKIVVINFIFTSCGDVCPLDTAQLKRVQELLGDQAGKRVHMYSISVDPETDTPARLRDFMDKFQIGAGWTFLTGKRADIDLIQTKLGLTPAGERPTAHSTSIILGNAATGQWMKRSPYENPQMLANMLTGHLDPSSPGPSAGQRQSYADAVAISNMSEGETLYRTRCASCHSIGGGDGLGPDLMNVSARRSPEWLDRWIREPDKMLAEGDPVATAQMAQYRNLPMPNLKLGQKQARELMAFIDAESVKAMEAKAADAHGHDHH